MDAPGKPEKRFYTFDEAAEYLKSAGLITTPRTVRKWARSGKLKPVRLGERARYVAKSELDRFVRALEASEQRPPHGEAA